LIHRQRKIAGAETGLLIRAEWIGGSNDDRWRCLLGEVTGDGRGYRLQVPLLSDPRPTFDQRL
jgi:hypothetical protein